MLSLGNVARTVRPGRNRDEKGAAAVESALVLGFILGPLLVGVIVLGIQLWGAQKAQALDPNTINGSVAGNLSCTELVDRVIAATNVEAENLGLGVPTGAQASGSVSPSGATGAFSVQVQVLHIDPTGLGADVRISVTSAATNQALEALPLANQGNLLSDLTMRLQNVHVTTQTC